MQDIVAVETPDDRTVRLVTRTPNVTIPRLMASYHLPIISRASEGGEPVGAGPFKIKATERGVAPDHEAFAEVFKTDLPKLKGVRRVGSRDHDLRVARGGR